MTRLSLQNLSEDESWEQSTKALRCIRLEHAEHYESFKSFPLQNPLNMALPHSTRGCLSWTQGVVPKGEIVHLLCVYAYFCVLWVCVVGVEDCFSLGLLSAGSLRASWASISLLDTHCSSDWEWAMVPGSYRPLEGAGWSLIRDQEHEMQMETIMEPWLLQSPKSSTSSQIPDIASVQVVHLWKSHTINLQ